MREIFKNISLSLFSLAIFSSIGFADTSSNPEQNDILRAFREAFILKPEQAIDIIDSNGMEAPRLYVMENLSSNELAQLLEQLFIPQGGEAIKHWAYNPTVSTNALNKNSYYHKKHKHKNGFEEDYFYITKAVRASQYIIFFLEYDVKDQYEQKTRAKKIAEALNLLDQDIAVAMLYGRYDARFLGDRDRLYKYAPSVWGYQTYEIDSRTGAPLYGGQTDEVFSQNTVEATVPLHLVRSLVSYLSTNLLSKIVEKEDAMSAKKLRTDL